MAISWSEDISSGAPIEKADVAEIKSQIDSLASWEGVSLTWDYFVDDGSSTDGDPIDSAIKTEQAQELRDNTDVIHNNRHTTVYTGENSGDNGSDYSTHQNGHNSGYNDSHDNSVV